MRKLLSANFSRLWKSKIFWILETISALTGALFYILAIINENNIGDGWYLTNGNFYFFIVLIYVGAVIAVFSGFYIGSEYSDETIRNKITVGGTRSNIYLSNLIVVVIAGILFVITQMVVSVCIGLPFLGTQIWKALSPVSWRIPTAFIMILCYGAIFTFLGMMDSNKSRNLIISFVFALLIIFAGLFTYSHLNEPKLTSRMIMQEDGSYLREFNISNPRYINGTIRIVYTFLDAFIPSSQGFNIARSEGVFNLLAVICQLGVTIAFTSVGIILFKKKDIK